MHPIPQAILLDFDYTLADSSAGVIDSVRFALAQLGLPPASEERICQTIGLSLPDTLVQLAGPEHAVQSAEFVRLFMQRADQVMADKTVLLPGVPAAIHAFRQQGLTLGIVSTKYRRRIVTILRREGLLEAFAVIVGGEDVRRHKPDPESLLLACSRLSVPPAHALYAGDSVTDAEAARRAGVPFAAVLSGTTPQPAFQGYDVLAIAPDLAGLYHTLFPATPPDEHPTG